MQSLPQEQKQRKSQETKNFQEDIPWHIQNNISPQEDEQCIPFGQKHGSEGWH